MSFFSQTAGRVLGYVAPVDSAQGGAGQESVADTSDDTLASRAGSITAIEEALSFLDELKRGDQVGSTPVADNVAGDSEARGSDHEQVAGTVFDAWVCMICMDATWTW